jgi:hypothetical protein
MACPSTSTRPDWIRRTAAMIPSRVDLPTSVGPDQAGQTRGWERERERQVIRVTPRDGFEADNNSKFREQTLELTIDHERIRIQALASDRGSVALSI